MILQSEHSPIRSLMYTWEWENLPSWVSVHFARHSVGWTPFVQTQRNDRQSDFDRRKAPQDTPVLMRVTANAQSIINVSHVRSCKKAAEETQEAWQMFLDALEPIEPALVMRCVPKCVYRNGLCCEPKPCGDFPADKWKRYKNLFIKER